MRIAIIGAGISGLAAAYALFRRKIAFTLFERSHQPGGVVRSETRNGYLLEHGPNSFQPKSETILDLLADLHLGNHLKIASRSASHRYIVKDGSLQPLPSSLVSFLTTPLFSAGAKARLCKEPFVGRGTSEDESIASFVRRRLGEEFLDYAVDPFVAGIFAGSAERLSVRHAFPKLFNLERLHGSLIRGSIKTARSRRRARKKSEWPSEIRKGLLSFDEGMYVFVRALYEHVEPDVRLGHSVSRISRMKGRWIVAAETGDDQIEDSFDAVISTVPLHSMPEIVSESPAGRSQFADVYYVPVTILHVGFDRSQIDHPLDGFGMLVPSKESFNILGALFSSSLFPGRAPEGKALLTVFIGGSRQPELIDRSTDELVQLTSNDLKQLIGTSGLPGFTHRVDWPRAIPQYEIGYGAVKERLTAMEVRNPGLKFAGNYRQGISVSDAVESGWRAGLHFALPDTVRNRMEPLRHPQSRGER